MITVDSQIVTRFEKILELRRVPLVLRSEYRKWLRYFLDFQFKYTPSNERSVQVRLFSQKLKRLTFSPQRRKGREDGKIFLGLDLE